MTETPDGYRLLARLRGLERQLRRLRRDWRSFRDEPTPETLSDVRVRSRRFADALESLSLAGGPDAASDPALGGDTSRGYVARERPAPRVVVSTSREIDAKIWEAAQRWKAVLDGDSGPDLDRLASALQGAADRVVTLIVALGGSQPPHRPTHISSSITAGNASASIEGAAAELAGMLWRLQADWQQVRGAPNVDRLRLLMESFVAAADVAARLRELRGHVGESRFRQALRVGRLLTDGVGFLPYRDPFTGIYNREGFDALAAAELKRCRRYGRGFGLLVLEISAPNLRGLRRAVATSRAELREYDLIARYVDDLIMIGVPEGGSGATRRVASRVLRALRTGDMGAWFQRLSYATMPEDGSTLSGLIHTARDRLQP